MKYKNISNSELGEKPLSLSVNLKLTSFAGTTLVHETRKKRPKVVRAALQANKAGRT